MTSRPLLSPVILITLGLCAPAHAQRGPWYDGPQRVVTQGNAEPSKRIDVETFRAADAGDALGNGRIVVMGTTPPAPPPPPATPDTLPAADDAPPPDSRLPVYEAAVIDQLAAKGYDTATAADPQSQVEIDLSRDVVVPEEAPHRPVSGEVSMGVSNRGSGFGGALFIDLSKPKKAIIATRMAVRIRSRASGRVLWEGHAEGQARATDGGNDDTRMATRLAVALFAHFPDGKVVQALP